MSNIINKLKEILNINDKETIVIDDGIILLRQQSIIEPCDFSFNVLTYLFNIELVETKEIIGRCELRLGMNNDLYYLGQVGYIIRENYRGHNYAYSACLLLFSLAKNNFEMNEIYITCSPDNIPSYKTLIKLGGKFIEKVYVPQEHFLYRQNELVKCIFKYKL
jgi:predicted acetyltransferase